MHHVPLQVADNNREKLMRVSAISRPSLSHSSVFFGGADEWRVASDAVNHTSHASTRSISMSSGDTTTGSGSCGVSCRASHHDALWSQNGNASPHQGNIDDSSMAHSGMCTNVTVAWLGDDDLQGVSVEEVEAVFAMTGQTGSSMYMSPGGV